MNGNIECAFIGRLGQDREKTSAADNSRNRLLLDEVGRPAPTELRLVAVFTLVTTECEDGIAPDKK